MRKQILRCACVLAGLCFAISSFSAETPLIAWKFKTGASVNSTVIVVDTVVYFGSNDSYFYAVNTNTGNEIWKFKAGFGINSKAAINDSLVFFESGYKLYALDKRTGTKVWEFVSHEGTLEMQLGTTDYHHCSPVIHDNKVFFGDGWGSMNGVDIKSGTLKFQYTITGDSAAIRSTPAIKDDIIYFGTWAGNAYAVSLKDSSLQWKYTLPNRRAYYGMITSEMVLKDSLLYFGSQHDVYTPVNINTGKAAWTFVDPKQTYLPSGPVFYNDAVIVGTTINTFKIYSLTNGNVNWSFSTDGILFVTPAVVDSILIMNTSNFGSSGTMYMVNIKNGSFISEYHFNNAAPSSPVVSAGKLFVGNGDGYLYAFNLNELLYAKEDTTIVMDTTTESFRFSQAEKKNVLKLTLMNIGNVCDDYILSCSLNTDVPKDGIPGIGAKAGHIWANNQTTLAFNIYPQKLTVGTFELTIQVHSKKLPDVVFSKKYIITIEQSTSVNSLETNSIDAVIYPNPAKDAININIQNFDKPVQLSIYSTTGQLISSLMLKNKQTSVPVAELTGKRLTGSYLYKLSSGENCKTGILEVK